MGNIKLAVIGSRTFNDYELLKKSILENYDINFIKLIISGKARGADELSEIFADEFNIAKKIFPADWSLGRFAGYLRNKDIINNATHVIGFWNGQSKGTANSLKLAKEQNKPTIIIKF